MADTQTDGRAGREISKIAFPYIALDDAIALASKLLAAGGVPMDRDQFAAAIGTAPTGGMFAVKLSGLKMFGLIATDAQGRLALTERGFEILEPARERQAKAEAFLSVELFRAVYEQFKGRQLPPRPTGLEQALVSLGVSSKQKDRARVMMDRSARLAGFFPTPAEDRLVAPIIIGRSEAPQSSDHFETASLTDSVVSPVGAVAPMQVSAKLDGVISALIAKLPTAGEKFPPNERTKWLTMMQMALDMAYGSDTELLSS
jgi:hypothetical protein